MLPQKLRGYFSDPSAITGIPILTSNKEEGWNVEYGEVSIVPKLSYGQWALSLRYAADICVEPVLLRHLSTIPTGSAPYPVSWPSGLVWLRWRGAVSVSTLAL